MEELAVNKARVYVESKKEKVKYLITEHSTKHMA